MIKVTIASTDERKTAIVEDTDSVKKILTDNGINYAKATLMLDGMILGAADINKTMKDLNVGADCIISVTIKMDNAA
jgi:hypothetical protein